MFTCCNLLDCLLDISKKIIMFLGHDYIMLLKFFKKFVTNCHYRSLIGDKEVRLCRTLIKYTLNIFQKFINLC